MAFAQFSRTLLSNTISRIASSSLPATTTTSLVNADSGRCAGGLFSAIFNRTNVRNNFPRAKETKRIKTHGWEKRMSTADGRRVLMRRLLKGRHVLSH